MMRKPTLPRKLKPLTSNGMVRAMKRLDTRLAALREERLAILARCPHDWEYHPDPSGNNDSYHRCRWCEKQSD